MDELQNRRRALMGIQGNGNPQEINGVCFKMNRAVVHIPADNGVTNTQGCQNYITALLGKTAISRSNCLVYWKYLEEPQNKPEYFILSIGPNNNVYRWGGTSYGWTAVGGGYSAALVEGDVEVAWFEIK